MSGPEPGAARDRWLTAHPVAHVAVHEEDSRVLGGEMVAVRDAVADTVADAMGRRGAELRLPAIRWSLADARQVADVGRPAVLAVSGCPDVSRPDAVRTAQRWASALGLWPDPRAVSGTRAWVGHAHGLLVRVWVPVDLRPSITCPSCSRTSFHPDDVRQRYCSVCGSHDGLLPKGDVAAGGEIR